MKLDQKKRQIVASVQKITSTIAEKLKESKDEVKDKVDLTKIAKDLSERRSRVLSGESPEGEE